MRSSGCGKLCGSNLSALDSTEFIPGLHGRQVFVTSMKAETSISETGVKILDYRFRCCAEFGESQPSWEVRRCFLDFQKLHSHLKKKGKVFAEFPSNNFISIIGAGLLNRNREHILRDYLNSVLSRCNDDQCVLLCKFLKVNKHLQCSNSKTSKGDLSEQPIQNRSPVSKPGRCPANNVTLAYFSYVWC
jgi:hypothetical protein